MFFSSESLHWSSCKKVFQVVQDQYFVRVLGYCERRLDKLLRLLGKPAIEISRQGTLVTKFIASLNKLRKSFSQTEII